MMLSHAELRVWQINNLSNWPPSAAGTQIVSTLQVSEFSSEGASMGSISLHGLRMPIPH